MKSIHWLILALFGGAAMTAFAAARLSTSNQEPQTNPSEAPLVASCMELKNYKMQIALVWLDNNTPPINLTDSKTDERDPAWSPDGKQIAFISERERGSQIFVMNADGSDVRNLTNDPKRFDSHPVWSPDGRRIAFSTAFSTPPKNEQHREIWVMDANGKNVKSLTAGANRFDALPYWLPGNQIGFFSDGQLWTMSASGKGAQAVTNSEIEMKDVAWSPDGKFVAFVNAKQAGYNQLYTMRSDGTDMKNIGTYGSADARPAWSPDSKQIAFTANLSVDDMGTLFVVDADGQNRTRVLDAYCSGISWRKTATNPQPLPAG
jgi:TolB protein